MATKTKRLRVLNQIYDALPRVECKGLCWVACSYINVMPIERVNLERAIGGPVPVLELEAEMTPILEPTSDGSCPYLKARRCSVYEARPFICRIYGTAEGMPCPFGCAPSSVLPDDDVPDLINRIRKL